MIVAAVVERIGLQVVDAVDTPAAQRVSSE